MQELAGRRAALYARHSKEHQAQSVPAQLARGRRFVDRHGGYVVEEYSDEAMTGAIMENRVGLQRLLRDAARRAFDVAVVEDLSRISRNQGDVARIFETLVYDEVQLVSVTEGVVNELHIGLKGTMNALYLKDVSDRARRGQYAAAARGRVPGGTQYGYDADPLATGDGRVTTGHRKINPETAAVVRAIFEAADAGTPLPEIAADLNRRGIPSPAGRQWSAASLAGTRWRAAGLLRRPIYKGKIVFGRSVVVRNPKTGQRQRRPRPRSQWLESDAPHLAIVSAELFDRVQLRLDEAHMRAEAATSPPKRLSPPPYITSGRTWCKLCGSRVTSADRQYLCCRAYKEHKACAHRWRMRRDDVVDAVLVRLRAPRSASAVAKALAKRCRDLRARSKAAASERRKVEGRLARAKREAHALIDLVEQGQGGALTRERLAEREREARRLSRRQAELTNEIDDAGTVAADDRKRMAEHAARRIADAAERLLADRTSPRETAVVASALASVHAGYAGPGRRNLEVSFELSPAGVYDLGREILSRG